ncbi:class I SAM-dependent methyltransferase [Variovorax sp. HJSM1_2]|uniref:class I SAM-dependent methyltransferase n=1 Tax=Variovorax sp. HJSM1_2 TaxID=3366263 RepID=UPI003BD87331
MDLKETDILGEKIGEHWYYQSKAKAVKNLLSNINTSTILDVGAGSGFFSKHLLAHSAAKEAWCVDISYAHDSDSSEAGKPVHFRRSIDSSNADLVLLMDVLEHVDDDVGLLTDYVSKVAKGTYFLISVPAFKFLWSEHDVFLEHKRRYRLSQIENVAQSSGLTVKHGAYYFGAVFPIAATVRLVGNLFHKESTQPRSQLKMHQPMVNATLAALSNAELPLMKKNRLAGLTAFCLAVS